MCTMITVSRAIWENYYNELLDRLERDRLYNDDGYSLVALDSANPSLNTVLRTMSFNAVLFTMDDFFGEASEDARVFIHLRAATTGNIGVGYNHAFDNMNGTFIMHNGIISNPNKYAVDSFEMLNSALHSAEGIFDFLLTRDELYANVFVIDTDDHTYGVVRLVTNTLFTDGYGNYSTNSFGPIIHPVEKYSVAKHAMLTPKSTYIYQDFLDEADQEYLKGWDDAY